MIARLSNLAAKTHRAALNVPCGNVTLAGELAVPPRAPGVVLFVHGSGSSRHSPRNQFVADVIHRAGLGTFLFDLLTVDEEIEDKATSQFRFNIGLLSERLAEVTRWIGRHMPQYQIGYFGASTGGGAALVAAAELGALTKAVVSRGGRPDLAGPVLRRVLAPTLLMVGEYDEVVLRINQASFIELQCQKELSVIPRATHLFEEPGALREVARLTAEWFQRYLFAGTENFSAEVTRTSTNNA